MRIILLTFFFFTSYAFVVISGASLKVLEVDSSFGNIDPARMLAGVFFTKSTTAPYLRHKFAVASTTEQKIRILLVPGHEPHFGGAEYKNLVERDMVVDLTQEIAQYLAADGRFEIIITRGKNSWNPEFESYFKEGVKIIEDFAVFQRKEMNRLVAEGKVARVPDTVPHNDAPGDVALRLYGINKWANDHGVDVVLHVHFNDYPRKRVAQAGEYSGFAIYVPEKQYSNAEASAALSEALFGRLAKVFPVSNMPKEDIGIIEDQELIAVGSFNTVDAASLLVEYAYVYEPQFSNPVIRRGLLKEMAFQTYLGFRDFFEFGTTVSDGSYNTALLPFEWKNVLSKSDVLSGDVLALQAALMHRGLYPPRDRAKNDCPLSGFFGPCTKAALVAFQKEFDVAQERGYVGETTRAVLNGLYADVR